MIRTRKAVAGDARWLVTSAAEYAAETGNHRLLPRSPDVCGRLWLHAIDTEVVFIVEEDACPVGFLLAWLGRHPFNPELRALTCGLWYVAPKWRHTRAGLLLFRAFDRFADAEADVAHFTLQRPTGDDTLRRAGYRIIERTGERWTSAG